jgi:hypothetical protein
MLPYHQDGVVFVLLIDEREVRHDGLLVLILKHRFRLEKLGDFQRIFRELECRIHFFLNRILIKYKCQLKTFEEKGKTDIFVLPIVVILMDCRDE